MILLRADSGRTGFPSEMVDDPLLSLVSPEAEPFENAEERRVMYSRAVEWMWSSAQGVDREGIYPKPFTSFHPIYSLEPDLIGWDVLEETVLGQDAARPTQSARPHVLIIDEINRANILKVFGELITLLEPDKRLGVNRRAKLTPYRRPILTPLKA